MSERYHVNKRVKFRRLGFVFAYEKRANLNQNGGGGQTSVKVTFLSKTKADF